MQIIDCVVGHKTARVFLSAFNDLANCWEEPSVVIVCERRQIHKLLSGDRTRTGNKLKKANCASAVQLLCNSCGFVLQLPCTCCAFPQHLLLYLLCICSAFALHLLCVCLTLGWHLPCICLAFFVQLLRIYLV